MYRYKNTNRVYYSYAYLAFVVHICSSINQCLDNLGMSIITSRDEGSAAVFILLEIDELVHNIVIKLGQH